MEDKYHQRHQYITTHEVENHKDNNQEITIIIIIIIITQILEIIEIIKNIGDQATTITEVPAITEIITVETEVIVTIEVITDTTIVDQAQDIQTETTQNNSHHKTKIIVIIAITDKDTTARILVGMTNIDNVRIVTTDITQTIITRITAEINHKTTITDTIIKKNAMMETDIIITKAE